MPTKSELMSPSAIDTKPVTTHVTDPYLMPKFTSVPEPTPKSTSAIKPQPKFVIEQQSMLATDPWPQSNTELKPLGHSLDHSLNPKPRNGHHNCTKNVQWLFSEEFY